MVSTLRPHNKVTDRHLLTAWSVAALSIPCLSAFGAPLRRWIAQTLGGVTITWIISLLLISLSAAAIRWLAVQSQNRNWSILILTTIALGIAFTSITLQLPRTEERLHFVVFGLFGFLSKRLHPIGLTIIIILTWSGGDELFQGWLADRVGDWRDVGMNIIASTMGISIAFLGMIISTTDRDSNAGAL